MSYLLSDHNSEDADRIKFLIAGFIRETLTEPEQDELDGWVSASEENLLLFEDLTDENDVEENLKFLDKVNTEKALRRIKVKIGMEKKTVRATRLWSYGIAASVILAIGVFAFFKLNRQGRGKDVEKAIVSQPDIAPGGNKAVLTTADGSTISLTDAAKGFLRNEFGTAITKTATGELTYTAGNSPQGTGTTFNTLSTPPGGQYKVVLPDGSKVWLNAVSSLKYPTAFTGPDRTVELTGEAYFEVTKNRVLPFKVKLPDASVVEVLGTSFNVMTYGDEINQQTTLIEGSVKLSRSNKEIIIKPGEQALVDKEGKLSINRSVNIGEITAWKEGNFDFRNASIETIMRQVQRWYDVEVVYQARINHEFTADVSRGEPVSQLLRLLELTNRVHFKIENKRIYVLP
ncbi:MAG: DUF4974 domain-containing protein [Sphingobacteriales bacterium]|nr:DUF4974 domain-containing protein [Sphingobacteriales bacterium]